MLKSAIFALACVILIPRTTCNDAEYCSAKNSESCKKDTEYSANWRYLFYDVNRPEGFNLRRDVYVRMAVLMHQLDGFKLVLPPWSRLRHWRYAEAPEMIPWGRYFDLESMRKFANVIDMHEFFSSIDRSYKKFEIEETYILQHFEDMFTSGNFEDRFQIEKCSKEYKLNYFYYSNITSNNIKCLSFHGASTKLKQFLKQTQAKTIFFEHAEVALHEIYGGKLFWEARRSMRFNKELREIAAKFRKKYLNSDDITDNITIPEDWRDEKPNRRPKGGPYLAIHLRRGDFLRRGTEIPTLQQVVEQITKKLQELELRIVFIATDATLDEYKEILRLLPSNYRAVRFKPSEEIENKYKDGGIAIIDQIICSHAKYFIGTAESTFTFRIQEEREILGFASETTFNAFCAHENRCQQLSVWKIVY